MESSHQSLEELVEQWLQKVRLSLPEGATAVVTVHKAAKRRYQVSFRASAYGETFISEVREEDLRHGVHLAGCHLLERLALNPPRPQVHFREKILRFFGEEAAVG